MGIGELSEPLTVYKLLYINSALEWWFNDYRITDSRSYPEKFDPKLLIQCILPSSIAKVGLLLDRFFYLAIFFSPSEMFRIWFLCFTVFLCLDLGLIHAGYALTLFSIYAVLCFWKFSIVISFNSCGPRSLYSLLLKCISYRSF